MQLIYNNFDALDLSFQGAFPEKILQQLSHAREQAQQEKRDVLVEIGKYNLPVMVSETGMRGGYRYRFDTGVDGEIWAVSHSTSSKNWNIRVSVKSLALALYGYEAVKESILKRLEDFETIGHSREGSVSEAVTNTPLERISRFDYCFDFVMPSAFEPVPKRFVAHQRAKKHVYGEKGHIANYSALNGDRVNTIRIGEMPGRQAVIYNKTKEITASSKHYWWDIWEIVPREFKDTEQKIWRIEVRAGRDELDKWGLKRFEDFSQKAGDIISSILKAIRYTDPIEKDTNRSRWPIAPIWQKAIEVSNKALSTYSTNAIRENILRDYRQNIIAGYRERLIGNAIGLAAAESRSISELTIVLEELSAHLEAIAKSDYKTLLKKFEKAEEKFRFLV